MRTIISRIMGSTRTKKCTLTTLVYSEKNLVLLEAVGLERSCSGAGNMYESRKSVSLSLGFCRVFFESRETCGMGLITDCDLRREGFLISGSSSFFESVSESLSRLVTERTFLRLLRPSKFVNLVGSLEGEVSHSKEFLMITKRSTNRTKGLVRK